ncbi:membrane protein [Streptomyces sp. NRRL F-5630]|uniref:membrane protein n=1 Tax=Streptomyces sp. NRRL F-5630 TaxID=1463864 RepID=UPI0004C6B57D|nr:membrane protein [Streptomyces sp. NRRL F-5630]
MRAETVERHPDGTDAPGTPPRARARGPRAARVLRRTALCVVLLVLVPVLAAGTWLRFSYAGEPGDGTRTRGRDALWLGHAWVDGRKDTGDLDRLVEQLRYTGVRELYVHAGPLEHDGTLPAKRYPKAFWLVAGLHERLPGLRVSAWLGDVLDTESPEGLGMADPSTRGAILTSARQVLDAGFQGLHVDFEPLHSGDRDFLALLSRLHTLTAARHAPLSVAAHQIDPLPSLHTLFGAVGGHEKYWSQSYFGQVARRVDQIAVMSYDTAMPLESLYGGYVAQQTALALDATPPATDLLMGMPFYHEDKPGHRAAAETVRAAVRGARLGLARTDRERTRFGLALYVDFAATETDWREYRDSWGAPVNRLG